jgi:hypothetical protein
MSEVVMQFLTPEQINTMVGKRKAA